MNQASPLASTAMLMDRQAPGTTTAAVRGSPEDSMTQDGGSPEPFDDVLDGLLADETTAAVGGPPEQPDGEVALDVVVQDGEAGFLALPMMLAGSCLVSTTEVSVSVDTPAPEALPVDVVLQQMPQMPEVPTLPPMPQPGAPDGLTPAPGTTDAVTPPLGTTGGLTIPLEVATQDQAIAAPLSPTPASSGAELAEADWTPVAVDPGQGEPSVRGAPVLQQTLSVDAPGLPEPVEAAANGPTVETTQAGQSGKEVSQTPGVAEGLVAVDTSAKPKAVPASATRSGPQGPDLGEPAPALSALVSDTAEARPAPPDGAMTPDVLFAHKLAEAAEAADADGRALIDRVTSAVRAGQRGGIQRMQVRLHPPELGQLRVDLRVTDLQLTAQLETQTVAARSMILDNLDTLRDNLALHGIQIQEFEVRVAPPQQGGDTGLYDGQPDGQAASQGQSGDQGQSHTSSEPEPEPTEVVALGETNDTSYVNVVV